MFHQFSPVDHLPRSHQEDIAITKELFMLVIQDQSVQAGNQTVAADFSSLKKMFCFMQALPLEVCKVVGMCCKTFVLKEEL